MASRFGRRRSGSQKKSRDAIDWSAMVRDEPESKVTSEHWIGADLNHELAEDTPPSSPDPLASMAPMPQISDLTVPPSADDRIPGEAPQTNESVAAWANIVSSPDMARMPSSTPSQASAVPGLIEPPPITRSDRPTETRAVPLAVSVAPTVTEEIAREPTLTVAPAEVPAVEWATVVRAAPVASAWLTDEDWADHGIELVDGLVFIDRPPPLDEVLSVLGSAAPRPTAQVPEPSTPVFAEPATEPIRSDGVVVTGAFASLVDDSPMMPRPVATPPAASATDVLTVRVVTDEVEMLSLSSEVLCSLRRNHMVYDATICPPEIQLGASVSAIRGTTWTAQEADLAWATVRELAGAAWYELCRRDCVQDAIVEVWVSIEDPDGLVTRQCRVEVPLTAGLTLDEFVHAHHQSIAAQAGGAWAREPG